MSREAFEKAYHEETGLYASWSPNNKGYTDVIAGMCYRMWQAAQAQAQVNQQLLEALRLLYETAGSIKADKHMLKNYPKLLGAFRVADIAIAAAEENNK